MGNAGNCLEGYLPMEAHSDLSALDDNGELLWGYFGYVCSVLLHVLFPPATQIYIMNV